MRDLAAAMPPDARAVPLTGLRLPAAEPLLRAFLDAVADTLTRDPEATLPYAATAPQPVEHLREWAAEAAAGVDAGLRLALRVEAPDDPATGRFRAVVVVQALADPTRVADLGDVWSGQAGGFGADARLDGLTAVRRAARFWDPLARLLSSAVPDVVELADPDLTDLLGDGGDALTAAGIAVHWPRELHPVVGTRAVARGPAPTSFAPGRLVWSSTGRWRWTASRSPPPSGTSWSRAGGPWCACAIAGCWSTPPPGGGRGRAPPARSPPSPRSAPR